MSKFIYTRQSYPNYIGIGTEQGGFICEWDPFSVILNVPRNRGVKKIVVWGTSNLVVLLESFGDKMCYVYDSEAKRIWDVIKTEEGIWDLQCVGDYLYIGMKEKVKRICLPSLKEDKEFTTITTPFLGGINGQVCVIPQTKKNSFYHSCKPNIVCKAHAHPIVCMAQDGNCVATASEKGTIVRVWEGSKQIWEGRRGIEPSRIMSMELSGQALVVATHKGSVHYFNIKDKKTKGYMWDELPKSRYVWYCGENPIVGIKKSMVYIADASGLITIGSLESGETLFQTSLLGDVSSPFTVPLS